MPLKFDEFLSKLQDKLRQMKICSEKHLKKYKDTSSRELNAYMQGRKEAFEDALKLIDLLLRG